MSERRSRRWFQVSLNSLFLLTLLVATFFAGYVLATKQAEAERGRAELEAQRAIEASRLKAEAELRRAQYDAEVARLLALQQQATQGSARLVPDFRDQNGQ